MLWKIITRFEMSETIADTEKVKWEKFLSN